MPRIAITVSDNVLSEMEKYIENAGQPEVTKSDVIKYALEMFFEYEKSIVLKEAYAKARFGKKYREEKKQGQ